MSGHLPSSEGHAPYRFGPFQLDPHTLELRKDDVLVPLEPLPARILLALVERAGRMVTREELRTLGWPRLPGAAEQSLNTCIRQIREALGDDATDPSYVETLRGRGYRFVARLDEGGEAPSWRRWGGPGRKVAAGVALGFALALAVVAVSRLRERPPSPLLIAVPTPMLLGDVPDGPVLAEALADELRAALAVVAPGRVEVLGRASTVRAFGPVPADDPPLSPGAVGATHLLQVSARPTEAGELRLVARLTDPTRGGVVVWGGAVDAGAGSLGGAAAVLARQLARSLGIPPAPRRNRGPDMPLAAQGRLLTARRLLEESRELPTALALLDTLVAEEPNQAEAHGARAEVLLLLGEPRRAADAAERSLALDPDDPAAHRALAGVRMLAGDWNRAERLLRETLVEAPNEASTLSALAFLLTARGRFAEAAATIQRALRADPLSPLLLGDAGRMHFWAGRYADAVRTCQEALRVLPEAMWARGCLFDAFLWDGRTEEASLEARDILESLGAPDRLPDSASAPETVASYRALRVASWKDAALRDGRDAFGLALAYADAGQPEEALAALERAADHPTLVTLTMAVDPRLRVLDGDPRFRSVLARFDLRTGRRAGPPPP